MTSYFLLFNLAAVLCTTFAHPAANDLKAKFAEDNEISPPKYSATGASAEFGGFKVAAGLGGGDSSGGVFAKAEAPSASAGAGAYGGAAASAGGGANANVGISGFGGFDSNKPGQNGQNGGFFDRIFNIPISVLHSVNSYVKTKANSAKRVASQSSKRDNPGHHVTRSADPAGPGSSETRFAGDSAEASVSGLSASASVGSGSTANGHRVRAKPDYDKIFNIPISALRSVNDFLNG